MTTETVSGEAKPKRAPKTMKMLSMAQAKNPMKHAFYGGFQNVAFQTGVVVKIPGDPPNRIYLRTDLKAKHPLPIHLPQGVRAPADGSFVKVTCTVLGATDQQGNPYPILVARMFAIPNILEADTRRIIDLCETAGDDTELLKKQTGVNNDIHLTGVAVKKVVERRMAPDGSFDPNPSVTIYLRLDADDTHIIPVVYDQKLAESSSEKIRFGSLISIRGQYQTKTVKIRKYDEQGKSVMNADGTPVYETDENGKVKVKYHPHIYVIGYPSGAPDKHMLFRGENATMPTPDWVQEMAREMNIRAQLGRAQNQKAMDAKVEAAKPQNDTRSSEALVTVEEVASSIAGSTRFGGL